MKYFATEMIVALRLVKQIAEFCLTL